ncbi:hypothetical protein N658DRAFT_171623 [Parathielavia hyrcaniae]|uniref:Uncharacterized protein n=1 Tax=Parathielavia hyrcaniae TaxID=113614 RepID=A0AAN6PWF6_9PEZI|nr:hypothetical protein N658DRAFT_171623 [Parathielavia hyrcaniae]
MKNRDQNSHHRSDANTRRAFGAHGLRRHGLLGQAGPGRQRHISARLWSSPILDETKLPWPWNPIDTLKSGEVVANTSADSTSTERLGQGPGLSSQALATTHAATVTEMPPWSKYRRRRASFQRGLQKGRVDGRFARHRASSLGSYAAWPRLSPGPKARVRARHWLPHRSLRLKSSHTQESIPRDPGWTA